MHLLHEVRERVDDSGLDGLQRLRAAVHDDVVHSLPFGGAAVGEVDSHVVVRSDGTGEQEAKRDEDEEEESDEADRKSPKRKSPSNQKSPRAKKGGKKDSGPAREVPDYSDLV